MGILFEKNLFKIAVANADILGPLADAHLGLYKTTVPLNEGTVKADLTAVIANYDGYAEANIDWQAPSFAANGEVEVVGTVPEFRPTGGNVDNVIIGGFVTRNTDDALLSFGEFTGTGIPMNDVTDAMVVTIRYRPRTSSLIVSID